MAQAADCCRRLAAIPLLVELCGKSYQGIATQFLILLSLQGASPGLDNACTSQRQKKHMHSARQDKVEQSEDRHGLIVAGKKQFEAWAYL